MSPSIYNDALLEAFNRAYSSTRMDRFSNANVFNIVSRGIRDQYIPRLLSDEIKKSATQMADLFRGMVLDIMSDTGYFVQETNEGKTEALRFLINFQANVWETWDKYQQPQIKLESQSLGK